MAADSTYRTEAQPLRFQEILGKGVRICATCIAPPPGDDWSLKDLYVPKDASLQERLVFRLRMQLARWGTRTVFAPSVAAMSGAIVPSRHLSDHIDLGEKYLLCRKRELPSDGTVLIPSEKQSFIMSGGGCPVIVAVGMGECVVAHASRDSLIDMHRVRSGNKSRNHESVLHAIAAQFLEFGIPLNRVGIRVLFTVKSKVFTHPFDHPVHGEANRQLYVDLKIRGFNSDVMNEGDGQFSIPAFVRDLSGQLGFGHTTSACPLPINGPFAYTRNANIDDPTLATRRNLVIVKAERP